jgi:hypothetical protein
VRTVRTPISSKDSGIRQFNSKPCIDEQESVGKDDWLGNLLMTQGKIVRNGAAGVKNDLLATSVADEY